MLADIYHQLLKEFGDTLKQTSKDSDERINQTGRGVFMTSCRKKVVNFDKFKNSIVKQYALNNSPNSCDALYMHNEQEWFLIEFKNGKIDEKKVFQIRGKIFQSLLLLMEQLDKTICFTRKNLDFILVYNEDRADRARIEIGKSLCKLANGSPFFPFGLEGLQQLYFKKVSVWTKKEFDAKFVQEYGGA